MIAAYRLAASKMVAGDYYVTMYKGNDLNEPPMRVHLWLENMTRIDLGNYTLRVFHTPGHTSGCISIIETTCGLLFSADSVFAEERYRTSPKAAASAIIWSLARLRCFGLQALYPGHGGFRRRLSKTYDQAICNAQMLLETRTSEKLDIFTRMLMRP
jgi:glyoxylase-like metal-dependent hydrolase (beta-lactamase superfamily II)